MYINYKTYQLQFLPVLQISNRKNYSYEISKMGTNLDTNVIL